jgi:TonB family protein
MLHPFISSPYTGGHVLPAPVLAFTTSLHAALIYAAVTSSGLAPRPHVQVETMEIVHFTELPLRRTPSRAAHAVRRAAHVLSAAAEEFRLPDLPRSFDVVLPDPPTMPDFAPDATATEFAYATGIADDVLHLGLGGRGGGRALRDGAFDESSVERRATPLSDNLSPLYPPRMVGRRVESTFEVIFVVDTTGTVDERTIEWPRAVQEDFTRAVAEVLTKWRFVPAQIGGRFVRQRVSQPFIFRMDRR